MTNTPDLFAASPSNACFFYTALKTPSIDPKVQKTRTDCERLWRVYSNYAEPNFLAEFALHFHQRWFEMALTVKLLELGAQVQKTEPPGPDVLVNLNGRRLWIEAVCATGGAPGLPNSVPAPPSSGMVPWNNIALRIRSSIEEKKTKFDRYLEMGIVSPDDQLLIALNVHEIPHASLDFERYVFRALYGVGDLTIKFDLDTKKAVSAENQQLVSIAKAVTGNPVGTMPFIDGSMPLISGALVNAFEAVAAAHVRFELTLYPNLTATQPWIPGDLSFDHEWQFESDADGWKGDRVDLTS
jgi:hypothetical protein